MYLHRQDIEGKVYEDLVSEGVKFDYICTTNSNEVGYNDCSNDMGAWRTYFEGEGLLHEEHCIQTTGRLYMIKNKWYGPNSTYGSNYYQFNTSYNSFPATVVPDLPYYASGVHVHKSGFLKKIRLVGDFNKENLEIHFAVNAQTKVDGTNTAENRIIYHDTTPKLTGTVRSKNYIIDLDINREVHEGEVITLLVNRSDNKGSTKYMYANVIEFIFE